MLEAGFHSALQPGVLSAEYPLRQKGEAMPRLFKKYSNEETQKGSYAQETRREMT